MMRADRLEEVLARARRGIRGRWCARRPDPPAPPPRAAPLTYRAGVSQPPQGQPDDVQDVVPGAPMPSYDRGDGGGGAATAGTRATVAFVLGILSVVGMPFFGPVAWILGRRAVHAADAVDAAAGSNRGVAVAGMVLGIIGTVMLVVVVFAVVAFVVFIVAGTRTP